MDNLHTARLILDRERQTKVSLRANLSQELSELLKHLVRNQMTVQQLSYAAAAKQIGFDGLRKWLLGVRKTARGGDQRPNLENAIRVVNWLESFEPERAYTQPLNVVDQFEAIAKAERSFFGDLV